MNIGDAAKRFGVHVDTLKRREFLGYIVTQYTQGGHRRYSENDIVTLINTVGVIIQKDSVGESIIKMFLEYAEIFTVWHIKLLELMDSPPEWFKKHEVKPTEFVISSNLQTVIETVYPELKKTTRIL